MKNVSLLKIFIALGILNVYLFTCVVVGSVNADSTITDPTAKPLDPDEDRPDDAHGAGTTDFVTSETLDPDGETSQPNIIDSLYTFPFEHIALAARPFSYVYRPSSRVKNINEAPASSSASGSSQASSSSSQSSSSQSLSSSRPQNSSSSSSSSSRPQSSSSSSSSSKPQSSSTSSSSSRPQSSSSSSVPSSSSKPPQSSSSSSSSTVSSSSTASSSSSSSTISSSSTTPSTPPTVIPSEAANEKLTVKDQKTGTVVSGNALDIISQIVMNEIGGSFADEAIKAQAVAAYTHVKWNNVHNLNPSVALQPDVSDRVRALVSQVIGEAVYYNGEMIQAVYSASSAGWTASSGSVWTNPLPYLQSVRCEWDEQYDPNYGRTKQFSSSDIKNRIANTTGINLTSDPSEWIKVVDYTEGKYVGKMTIGGRDTYTNSSGRNVAITGRIFRETIMSLDIRSVAFDVSYDAASDRFTFTTYGYGHGVGLSQNGANIAATHLGWNYKQILEFYYQGTIVM